MTDSKTIPDYVDLVTMAKWLGWTYKKTHGLFTRYGYAKPISGLGQRLYVSKATLRDLLPDLYMALLSKVAEEEAVRMLDQD